MIIDTHRGHELVEWEGESALSLSKKEVESKTRLALGTRAGDSTHVFREHQY